MRELAAGPAARSFAGGTIMPMGVPWGGEDRGQAPSAWPGSRCRKGPPQGCGGFSGMLPGPCPGSSP